MEPARPPKSVRKHLRELASVAYERELNRELETLAAEFERWRLGALSPWDLSERIHAFHQGPARDLFVFYRDLDEAMVVGRALAEGILEQKEIPAEVLPHVASTCEFYGSRRGDAGHEAEEEGVAGGEADQPETT
jgi:hypothetical protein